MKLAYFHRNCKKKYAKMIGRMPWINEKNTPLTVKMELSKTFKSPYFLMIKGHINPKITSLCEKL